MKLFWTLWVLDALAALLILYFFFVGIGDGTVSSLNIGLWLIILLLLAGVLGGSYYFFNKGQTTLSYVILSLLAIPAILMFIFMLILIFGNVRWN